MKWIRNFDLNTEPVVLTNRISLVQLRVTEYMPHVTDSFTTPIGNYPQQPFSLHIVAPQLFGLPASLVHSR